MEVICLFVTDTTGIKKCELILLIFFPILLAVAYVFWYTELKNGVLFTPSCKVYLQCGQKFVKNMQNIS